MRPTIHKDDRVGKVIIGVALIKILSLSIGIWHSLISENNRKRWLINGHRIKLGHQDGRLTVFYFEDSVLNLDEASWLEAVDRIKVETNLLSG